MLNTTNASSFQKSPRRRPLERFAGLHTNPHPSRAQQRILRQYLRLGSWQKVASKYAINRFYVFEFGKHGVEPVNDEIAAALGIRRKHRKQRTINEHLATDPLFDMPADLLAYAFAHRQEMTA